MEFTREQKLAFTSDRHLVISANAGSGKTRILVERFLQILEHDKANSDNPESIIAITFTKKAASEMFARIISSLGKMIKEETDPDKRYRFRRIRSRIFQAKVSTIHSFCSSLLRDYAVEANISPNFQDLSETEKHLLYKDAKFNAIEDILQDDSDLSIEFRDLLNRNKMYLIESVIDVVLNNRYEYMQMKESLGQDGYSIIDAKENKEIILSILSKYKEGIELILFALENIDLEQKSVKKYVNTIQDFQAQILPKAKSILSKYDSNPIEAIRSCFEILNTEEKFGRSYWYKFVGGKVDFSAKDKEILEKTYLLISKDCKAFTNTEANERFAELQRTAYHFVDTLLAIADKEKEDKAVMDFDDLILRAKSLLSDSLIREMAMKKVKHIMVDEFQDTNQLQYDILQDMVPELKDQNSDKEQPNLFIVGDGKQSIYAFRNADVRVFNAAAEKIAQINSRKMAESKLPTALRNFSGEPLEYIGNENNGILSLNASFRLSPVVAAFVNKICGSIMDTKLSQFEVEYEDLVFAKNSTAIKKEILDRFPNYLFDNPNQIFEADPQEHGSVSFVIHKEEKDGGSEEKKESPHKTEATKLIRYIKSKVNGDEPYKVFEDGSFREAKYKDVGILIRSRTNVSELMNACIEEKVPFVLHAGSGLYKLQEVQDMVALLKFLYNPNDDIACIGTLRSPFFKISDKELYNISQTAKNETFWNKAIIYSESDQTTEHFIEVFNYLSKILSVSGRLSPTELLGKLIYDRAYFEKLADDQAIDQIKASVEKFVSHIRAFEEKGFADIHDLVQEINILLEISKDGEASVSSDNAVNIMTTHASKGLEFPIVALYNTNYKQQKSDSVYFSKNFGIAFRDKDVNESTGLLEPIDNIYYLLNREIKKQAEEAEEKRLLYVALTRAKDHLIISANISYTKKDKKVNLTSYAKSIFDVLLSENTTDYSPNKLYQLFYESEISSTHITRQPISFLENNELNNMLLAYHLPIMYEIEQKEGTMESDELKLQEDREESAFIPARYHNEVFSASKIMSYKTDPHDYEMKYLVGMSPKSQHFNPDSDKENDELSGNVLGIYIHEAMAKLNSWWIDGKTDRQKLEEIIKVLLKRQNQYKEENLSKVTDLCIGIVNTDYIRSHSKNLQEAQFELELNIPIEIHYLTGSIDCLIKDENGDLVIWDWKTNKISDYSGIEELSKHYKHQMSIYAYLVYLLCNEQETFKAKLLFTDFAERSENNNWVYSFEWSREEIIAIGEDLDATVAELSKKYY